MVSHLDRLDVSLLLAHAGAGHSWQGMVTLAGLLLGCVLLAAAAGRITVERPDDLVVPLAVTAVISSLGTMLSQWLSDIIGVGLPIGVIALVALLLAALTPLDLRLPAPLPMGAIALAIVSTVLLHGPISAALHPATDVLPSADDAELQITAPQPDEAFEAGAVEVEVEVTGGSIGPGDLPQDRLPDDPEEAGALAVAIQQVEDDGTTTPQQRVDVALDEQCTVEEPCTSVSFEVLVEPGTHRLTVDLTRGDGTPFATNVRDQVTFTAG